VARPKSEDKRNAILNTAIRLFAERGLTAAPTSEISKQAGVAEGTLFTYFKTKDDLINALYREIKLELADAMMSDFPRKKNVRTRLQVFALAGLWDQWKSPDGQIIESLHDPDPAGGQVRLVARSRRE